MFGASVRELCIWVVIMISMKSQHYASPTGGARLSQYNNSCWTQELLQACLCELMSHLSCPDLLQCLCHHELCVSSHELFVLESQLVAIA